MTIEIQIRPVTKENGKFIAYYAMEDIYPYEKEFFLGVSLPCTHLRGMNHVSFNQYHNEPEMPDGLFSNEDLMNAFQFYADYVWRMADELKEMQEWEKQMEGK